ncbi:hypothetical protein ACFQ0D_24685, partial [Micromonospora zhanjiangensis]
MADNYPSLLDAEFESYRATVLSRVVPAGPDAVRHTVRRRRRNTTAAAAVPGVYFISCRTGSASSGSIRSSR